MGDYPAVARALNALADIERDGCITSGLAQRGRDLVGLIFQPDSVYASISPIDDGDLSFYWVAGDRSINIELCADGDDWYCVRNGNERRAHEGGTPRWMFDALAEFSAAVEAVNPHWREQAS